MKSRKIIYLAICAVSIVMIGCGVKSRISDNSEENNKANDAYTEDVIQSEEKSIEDDSSKEVKSTELIDTSDTDKEKEAEQIKDSESDTDSKADTDTIAQVDVDLTAMSSLLVYSEVYNMVYYPERYVGKTIRMKGINSVYQDETSGKYYFACFIMDATACCSQGIEYRLKEDYKIPDDYPKDGVDVCVEGRFETYYEGDYLYCTLTDAVLAE